MRPYRVTRRLARDRERAVLGGVCAGAARYIGVNVFWCRVVTVLAALCVPEFVVIAYIVGWVALDSR